MVTLNKRKVGAKAEAQARSVDRQDMVDVIDRAARAYGPKVRGGQKDSEGPGYRAAFLSRKVSLQRRARSIPPFNAHAAPQALSATNFISTTSRRKPQRQPGFVDAQERGDHTEARITKDVYRRKPAVVMPLKR